MKLLPERRPAPFVVLVALFTITAVLLITVQLPGRSLFWQATQNAGHSLVFFLLSFVTATLLRVYSSFRPAAIFIIVLVSCQLMGGLVELVQPEVGRDGNWGDFFLDLLGALAGLSLYLSLLPNGRGRWWWLLLSSLLVAAALAHPVQMKLAERERAQVFPVIADFENYWLNLYLLPVSGAGYRTEVVPEWQQNQTPAARIEFHPGAWPGLMIHEVHPDWRAGSALSFDVFNPAEDTLRLTLRINDRHHNQRYGDRFNRTFDVKPGAHHFTVSMDAIRNGPKEREMDLSAVTMMMFYSYKMKKNAVIYLDNVVIHQ